jgi:hypothetical protein
MTQNAINNKASELSVGNLLFSGNTISSTDPNGNIFITPDGTGEVIVPTLTGTTINGGNLRLEGNTLSSTNTNGDINIIPDGTGVVNIPGLSFGNISIGQVTPNTIASTDTNGAVVIQPNGTGITQFKNGATNVLLNMESTGNLTLPRTACFYAILPSNASNITGNGTLYRIGSTRSLSVVLNQGSHFTANGIFTAPVTGNYLFTVGAGLSGLSSSHTQGSIRIQSSSQNVFVTGMNPWEVHALGGVGEAAMSGAVVFRLAAGDTCRFNVRSSNGAKTVDLEASGRTFVSGCLIS